MFSFTFICVRKILYIFRCEHLLIWRQTCEQSETAQGANGHEGFNKWKLANWKIIWKCVEYDTDKSVSCCLWVPFLSFLIKWELWLVTVTLCNKHEVVWKYLGLWLVKNHGFLSNAEQLCKKLKLDRLNLWEPMWHNHACWGAWHCKASLSYLLKVMASGGGSWGLEESNDRCHLQLGYEGGSGDPLLN